MTHANLPPEDSKAKAILVTLSNIPYGKVSTYGDIAKYAGYPGLARYVASTLKKLPKNTTIPWHRVINSRGKSSFPPNSDKYHQQVQLLKAEGIVFSTTDTVLKSSFW